MSTYYNDRAQFDTINSLIENGNKADSIAAMKRLQVLKRPVFINYLFHDLNQPERALMVAGLYASQFKGA